MLQRRSGAGRTARALTLSEAAGGRAAAPACRSSAASPPASRCWPRRTARASCRSPPARCPGAGEDLFALRVRGESMINAHICDGDLVLVRRQDSAQPTTSSWRMVESEAGDEATVKRFQRDGERVVLKPEHPTMAPIVDRSARAPGPRSSARSSDCCEDSEDRASSVEAAMNAHAVAIRRCSAA